MPTVYFFYLEVKKSIFIFICLITKLFENRRYLE